MDDENLFEEYYRETFKEGLAKQKGEPFSFEPKGKDAVTDAKAIKAPINVFIKKLNALIGETYDAEKAKGVRPDLIVTLIMGGLAFTLANVFQMTIVPLAPDMDQEECERTFMSMFRSSVKDIKKSSEEDK